MDRTWFLHMGDVSRDPLEVELPNPAGSAISTLADYGRFLEMIVHDGLAPDGTRMLAPESVAEMQRNQIADARYAFASRFRMQAKTPYGLGEWLDQVDGDGQGVVVSSDGKFGFRPWIDRTNDLFGVYLVDDRLGVGYVEGDPEGTAADADKVPTSGLWVFEWVAEALGGTWQ
jgi:CubicO group peptidase (beta-lactamase class C family)